MKYLPRINANHAFNIACEDMISEGILPNQFLKLNPGTMRKRFPLEVVIPIEECPIERQQHISKDFYPNMDMIFKKDKLKTNHDIMDEYFQNLEKKKALEVVENFYKNENSLLENSHFANHLESLINSKLKEYINAVNYRKSTRDIKKQLFDLRKKLYDFQIENNIED